MMTTVMHPDAFPVEKVQLNGWNGKLGHIASCELRAVTQAASSLAMGLRRIKQAYCLVSESTGFFDVTIKQMLDTFKS